MAFIDEHRDQFGVEPICAVLREHGVGIAPNTYHVAKNRPPSKREVRDEELKIEIQRVFDENLLVYGADKIWTQLNRENIAVARCTIERLMGEMGLSGARRGKQYKVTPTSESLLHVEVTGLSVSGVRLEALKRGHPGHLGQLTATTCG